MVVAGSRCRFAYGSADTHSLSLAPVNLDWFYLSCADSPGYSRTKSKRAVKWLCVCACVRVCVMKVNRYLDDTGLPLRIKNLESGKSRGIYVFLENCPITV